MSSFRAELHGEILVLHFSAPGAGNSFALEDARELTALLKQHRNARAVVVLSGTPRLFCSGGRLSDYARLKQKAQGLKINGEITKHLESFAKWPGLKMALVNGDCYGGGMEWLGCFDFRWCVPSVLFSFWQRRIGLTPGWGGGKRWARILGEGMVRAQLLAADVFGCEEALRRGVVDRVVLEEKILAEALEWLERVLKRSDVLPVNWTAAGEKKMFADLWWSEAHRKVLKRWE